MTKRIRPSAGTMPPRRQQRRGCARSGDDRRADEPARVEVSRSAPATASGTTRVLACAAALLTIAAGYAAAQPPSPSPGPPPSPRESAAFDITGQWVSIVNEDWRWRMMTPPKGDYTSLGMLNAQGRAVADGWDPAQNGSCKAYGAAGLMRMPTRLRIEWQTDDLLLFETDAGAQRRELRFAPPAARPPSLQGDSMARWVRTLRASRGLGGPATAGPPPPGGSLTVTTTNLTPGWLRKNGVPYSERTTLTEHFDAFESPNGDDWLIVTTIVEDPVYLNGRYVTSSHFKRETDRSKWNLTPCRND